MNYIPISNDGNNSESGQPFTYSNVTCSEDFDSKSLKEFLNQRGVYGKGLWRHIHPKTAVQGLKFGSLLYDKVPFVLPEEDAILELPIPESDRPSLVQPLQNWHQYYCVRHFSLDSPISALLDYPLTLYWIITNCLPQLYPASYERIKTSKTICLHVIGIEKEADMFPAFLECGRLLTPIKLDIHFFGNEICKTVDGKNHSQENISICLHSTLYHEAIGVGGIADCVIGFNAGLSAYQSFVKTIQNILVNDIPFLCTDYCYNSVQHTKSMLEKMMISKVSEILDNPFHGPFRIPAKGLEYPCFSNAVVFSLQKI